ncbi:MAG: glycoside hydrolase family 3 N-terminal domain-containing protein [Planctomycetota bacterium]
MTTPAAAAPSASEPAALRFDLIAGSLDHRISRLVDQMTLEEKVGQLVQVYPSDTELSEETAALVRAGAIGSLFYPGKREVVDDAQRIAKEESRLGIPLLIARDVIHGFRTVMPIPIGQAATWNPELVEQGAVVATEEAIAEGIDWTFAPMIDISRDGRWGRIAETLGEDPLLAGELAAAMVRGFQQEENGRIRGMVACGKHFVGYGFSEGGRDYNRVSVSQIDVHNTLLPPFERALEAGCRTVMTTFSEVNGLPGTAHAPLLNGVLKSDWRFGGVVVSDWASVTEMVAHGFARDDAHAAELAVRAGVDMDMCSPAYSGHLVRHVREGRVAEERVDDAVRRVLKLKAELAERETRAKEWAPTAASREVAREAVRQSVVLLKNDGVLPLAEKKLSRVAVIGPMADAPKQQLGCWALDGRPDDSVTPLAALTERLEGKAEVVYAKGAKNSFAADRSRIEQAVDAAKGADVAVLFLGEDAVLSGEARCRAAIDLPGVQSELLAAVAETGTPTVVVLLAGRPLAIGPDLPSAEAVMFAWHPGTMAGDGIADLLFGDANPSGKLPVTFPKDAGQIPIYYNHPNTGRPMPEGFRPLVGSGLDDLPPEFQYRSHYLDVPATPLFPFGFGLSYTSFTYSDLSPSEQLTAPYGESVSVSVTVANTGAKAGAEVVQLYLRDRTSSIVRPVRELKRFRRVELEPGEAKRLEFELAPEDFAYYDAAGRSIIEPGLFDVMVGGSSLADLATAIEIQPPPTQVATGAAGEAPAATTSAKPTASSSR